MTDDRPASSFSAPVSSSVARGLLVAGAGGRGAGNPDEEANEEEREDPPPSELLANRSVSIPGGIEGRLLGRFIRSTTGSPPSV